MSKRLVVVLCIAVALVSFIGGAAYKYEDYRPVTGEQWLEDGTLHTKFTAYFTMPVDTKTAYIWLDFVTNYHQYCIDNGKLIDDTPV